MSLSLTGAEKKSLRAQGQLLSDSLRVGREGAAAPVVAELSRLLQTRQLVKVRFVQAEREQRATLADALAVATGSACIASVGRTALFYRPAERTTEPGNDPAATRVTRPAGAERSA